MNKILGGYDGEFDTTQAGAVISFLFLHVMIVLVFLKTGAFDPLTYGGGLAAWAAGVGALFKLDESAAKDARH